MSDARSNLLTRGMRGDAKTISGISFAWDGDWYHASGTATGNIGWRAYKSTDTPIVADKKYTLSVEFAGGMPDADSYFNTSFQLFSDFRNNRFKAYAMDRNEHVALSFDQATLDGYGAGFQLWGPIIHKGATVDLRVRWMLVGGDTPAAWAPAEGEELAGGGAQMSANLLAGVKPTVTRYGSMADGVITSSTPKDDWKDVATWPITTGTLAENQTMYIGISAKWHGAAATSGIAWASVKYADAAGSINNTNTPISGITTEWKRFALSAVIPSGMHIVDFHISGYHLDAAYDATSLVLSYGSPVTLASSAHTPYATQDHISATYATKASLKVTDDSVKAEVSARAQTDRNVADLSSRLTQTANSLSSEISDRRSAITTVTGLANAAQSTADAAKSSASNAVSTANSASSSAANAVETANAASSAASAASTAAGKASTDAAAAVKTANSASSTASGAVTTANEAAATANAASDTATAAQTMATENRSSIKQLSNSITSEVTQRTKTDQMVSDLSSKLTQTADGFNASIDRLSDTDKKVNSWFGFGADASGNPQLTMGSSSSPVVGVYTNTGLAYRSRSGATLLELDGASRSSTMPHVHADDVSMGSWQWVPTQNGTHFTLQWIGG